MAVVNVVGAGLAGLAAAVRLTQLGRRVVLHEAAQQAGGRCRSYFDQTLARIIDNGNHLLLSGNRDALAYLEAIGASDSLIGPETASFPFLDLETGAHWIIRPSPGLVPFWITQPAQRVPGTRLREYLAGCRLAMARDNVTVAACLDRGNPLWRAFWDPLATAVLNTPPATGSARLLWAAIKESFARGGAGCRPLIARESLAASLIDPALDYLSREDAEVRFGQRLRAIEHNDRATALDFGRDRIELSRDDGVVLALPPGQTAALLPEIDAPSASHAIVNAHFVLPEPARLPEDNVLLGLIGGTAQWLFARGPLVSLTVSAADALAEQSAEAIITLLWADTAKALDLPENPRPPGRIVKEKRATFAQTPVAVAKRPGTRTRWPNLFLAGDWTATGLPATIEGAVRSGHEAARHAAG